MRLSIFGRGIGIALIASIMLLTHSESAHACGLIRRLLKSKYTWFAVAAGTGISYIWRRNQVPVPESSLQNPLNLPDLAPVSNSYVGGDAVERLHGDARQVGDVSNPNVGDGKDEKKANEKKKADEEKLYRLSPAGVDFLRKIVVDLEDSDVPLWLGIKRDPIVLLKLWSKFADEKKIATDGAHLSDKTKFDATEVEFKRYLADNRAKIWKPQLRPKVRNQSSLPNFHFTQNVTTKM